MTFYSRITSVPEIYMYQFSSPDKSTFLIRLLKELRLSKFRSLPGNLDQIRGPKYLNTDECRPYRTVSNLGSSFYCVFRALNNLEM